MCLAKASITHLFTALNNLALSFCYKLLKSREENKVLEAD